MRFSQKAAISSLWTSEGPPYLMDFFLKMAYSSALTRTDRVGETTRFVINFLSNLFADVGNYGTMKTSVNNFLKIFMSMQPIVVHSLPISFDAYIRKGWKLVAIPPGSKGPKSAAWNKPENVLSDSTQIPAGHGVGLAHAYSGTCAIDIDNWDAASAMLGEHGINLTALYNALDAVTVESGRQGRGKLLYRMPLGLALPSKKLNYTAADGSKQVAYELRCATTNGLTVQDCLPPSIHPQTLRPYQWGGHGRWENLPTLPTELFTLWSDLTKQDQVRTISTDTIPASWDDIRSALTHITADCSRDHWLTCLMALHHAGSQVGQLDQAEALAHEWSASATTKYAGQRDFQAVWNSLKADNGIKIGSLFHIAMEHGYKRPTPDVSKLFKSVTPAPPIQVMEDMRPPPPEPDLNLWPELLAARAIEVADQVGCDPLVPLFAGIATVCGAVDSRTRLELMPGYQVPPVLWLMTIGDPADKKTPGARPMMRILRQIEAEDVVRYKRSLLEWEALDHVHSQSKKAFITSAGQSTETLVSGQIDYDAAPPVSPEPPPKPVDLRLTVDDITSQKLVRIVADRPRGVLCHLDEMASWVNKLTDPKSGEDRSCWTKAYESDPYSMDRVGAENTIYASNFAVSIYGNIQPQVFKTKLKILSADGLLQRFIPAVLRPENTKLGEPVPDMFTRKSEWEMKIREIYALPIQTYSLDSQAYEAYREFQRWYEGAKKDERLLNSDPIYMQAFGKLEGTCGRIILTMHLMTNPYALKVPVHTTQKAIDFVRGYLIPAYRYALGETGGLVDESLDRWIAERMVQLSGTEQTVSLGDLRRAAARQLDGLQRHVANQMIVDAMEPLEAQGWVTMINDHKDKKTWAINPHIQVMHRGQQIEIIKAKQRRYDDTRTIVLRSGKYTHRRFAKGYDPATMDDKEYPA